VSEATQLPKHFAYQSL